MPLRLRTFTVAGLTLFAAHAAVLIAVAQHPRDGAIHDADTRAWWHTTEDLSNDGMEGRDTGSPAYQRAAEYVVKRLAAAGLKPAGENGTWFQNVPMHELRLEADSSVRAVPKQGAAYDLHLQRDIYIQSLRVTGSIEGELAFRGACDLAAIGDVTGRMVLCMGGSRGAAGRLQNAQRAGAKGVIVVDDPYYTAEPTRWPFAYSRSVTLRGAPPAAGTPIFTAMLNPEAFKKLLQGSGHDGAELLKASSGKQAMESFDLPVSLAVTIHTSERDLAANNVLAMLPGTDAEAAKQYVAVSAHLDGYGYGEPVDGDRIYNGTLDDAAYVALMIQMADDRHRRRADAGGDALAGSKRSLLFCVFTGEEKGLLGARWFINHMTVPAESIVADVNLDQLRPLFPLHALTALAVHDTTLGATAETVGADFNIGIREDRQPERGLLRRADHFPFLERGIPAIGFIFAFEPGTDDEKRYQEWYHVRYHSPKDDLTQPMDFDAARAFDQFFYRFVAAVADAAERPAMLPGSPFLKH